MQETFEHNISQQLSDFKLQPSPIIWQEVDAALHPERKKRFIIWWWLSAAIIGISVVSYWWVNDHNNIDNKKTITTIASHHNKNEEHKKSALNLREQKRERLSLKIDKQLVIANEKYQKAILGRTQKVLPLAISAIDVNNDKSDDNKLIVNNNSLAETTDNVTYNLKNNNQPINNAQNNIVVNKSNTDTNKTITAKLNADTSSKLKKEKKAIIKSHWLASFGGGILKTSLNYNNSNNFISSASSIGGNGGFTNVNNTTQSSLTSPNTGYHLQLGLVYRTEINKNWQVQIGLQYIYLSNTINLKADTTTGVTNSFIADNSNGVTNKAQWLQLPVTFGYTISPSSKHPVSLLFGGSLAYVVSEQWLISNSTTNRYYYDASINKRWLFGINTGLSYSVTQNLDISATAAYTLSPLQSHIADKNHLIQYNLQISTPINFSKKTKNKK